MTFHRYVTIDDTRIFYREAEKPGAPVLLLLHGFPASSFMFRDLIARLSGHFHIVAPDYPGFGYSGAPPDDANYTFDYLAYVMERFTDQLGLKKYGIYMQDFGGPVGFRLAYRHPERVSFFVIQNANAYDEGLPDSFWAPVRQLWATPSRENYDRIREAGISREALEWNYTHGVKDRERISPDSWELQDVLLNRQGNKELMLKLLYDYRSNPPEYPKWQDYFRRHQPPALVVWGKNDIIFPESGAHPYKRDLKDIDFNLLDTGHFALEDHAEEISGLIRGFAAKQGLQ
jgi:pimeloyl-ACP methyl ester carboxylesterase